MKLRHLGWASVEVEHEGQTLLIDSIKDSFPMISADEIVAPLTPGRAVAALVTHLHSDHADPVNVAAALATGAPVFRPAPNPGSGDDLIMTKQAETQFRASGLNPEVIPPWTTRNAGPFRITAVPAVDGFGDPQHSWVVECDGVKILHAGDTLFHGYWWSIARAVGPIAVAFLPINGPTLIIPHVQPPSPLHAAMLPEEAAVAAQILRARIGVPIHYELLNRPPEYTETLRAAERFSTETRQVGVIPLIPKRGEWFSPK